MKFPRELKLKRILFKTFLYSLIILSIPYLFLLWSAKKGLDTFLSYHSLDGDLEYSWMLIDFNGRIFLFDNYFYNNKGQILLHADRIEIKTTSVFDFVDANEKVVYQDYPSKIKLNIIEGRINKPYQVLNSLGLEYSDSLASRFFPTSCAEQLDYSLPQVDFDLSSDILVDKISDLVKVNSLFNSVAVAQLNLSYQINNYSEIRNGGGFVSDLAIVLSDMLWLQQKTSSCITINQNTKDTFVLDLATKLIEQAKIGGTLLKEESATVIADFMFSPQALTIAFNQSTDKKLSQIPLLPLYEFENQSGLIVSLNNLKVEGFTKKGTVNLENKLTTEENSKTPETDLPKVIQLSVNLSLRNYLGSKVLLNLMNQQRVEGYLSEVNKEDLKIYQLKHKGKTVLPYKFSEIESVTLLRNNKLKPK